MPNEYPSWRQYAEEPRRKKGCGCMALALGAATLLVGLPAVAWLVLMHSALPLHLVASALRKTEPALVVMNGISGSISSGFRVARIESGGSVFEDVRFHSPGILQMIHRGELIVHDLHIGKARVIADFTPLKPADEVREKTTDLNEKTTDLESSGNSNGFYFQLDRVSLNDIVFTDRVTGTSFGIPALEWTGFKAGKGQFDFGNLHVDSNIAVVTTTRPATAQDRWRLDIIIQPAAHQKILKPIDISINVAAADGQARATIPEIRAFNGAFRYTDQKMVIDGLDLAAYIDGPLPRDLHIIAESKPMTPGAGDSFHQLHCRGSFRLGATTITFQPPVELAGGGPFGQAVTIATGHDGDTEFLFSIPAHEHTSNPLDFKPLITSNPPLKPDEILARIFHQAGFDSLDPAAREEISIMRGWFRFPEN